MLLLSIVKCMLAKLKLNASLQLHVLSWKGTIAAAAKSDAWLRYSHVAN